MAWALILLAVLATGAAGLRLRRGLRGGGRAELQLLEERELGRRVEAAYWRLGYRVQRPPSDAETAHLIVSRDGRTTAVQATRQADERAVQEVAELRARYGCDRALVVVPGRLDESARRTARLAGVEMLGGRELLQFLTSVQRV